MRSSCARSSETQLSSMSPPPALFCPPLDLYDSNWGCWSLLAGSRPRAASWPTSSCWPWAPASQPGRPAPAPAVGSPHSAAGSQLNIFCIMWGQHQCPPTHHLITPSQLLGPLGHLMLEDALSSASLPLIWTFVKSKHTYTYAIILSSFQSPSLLPLGTNITACLPGLALTM